MTILGRAKNKLQSFAQWPRHQKLWHQRKTAEVLLNRFSRESDQEFNGTVLVDAGWDNPNYWTRYSLIRKALGLHHSREVGLLGPTRRKYQQRTLKHFGIHTTFDVTEKRSYSKQNRKLAEEIWRGVQSPEDILNLDLPFKLPAVWLYDYLLKKQRRGVVDINASSVIEHTHFFFDCLSAAELALKTYQPHLVISSHCVGWYVAQVWLAVCHGIPVVVLYGQYELSRFWKLSSPEHIYNFFDRPSGAQYRQMPETVKEGFARRGRELFQKRLEGQSKDLGGRLSFNRQESVARREICHQLGWDPNKKIIGVYASNWFDYPHFLGMSRFRDFVDWIQSVEMVATTNTDVQWLFKSHPCDDWYGGLTLSDVVDFSEHRHVKLASTRWDGSSVLRAIDGALTYHGTVGVECTVMGKPVMVADVGPYYDWGFARYPESREAYLQLLGTPWWDQMDIEKNATKACVYAGCVWGMSDWQKNLLFQDDSEQWSLYASTPSFLLENTAALKKEIEMIAAWFVSDAPHYHTYKQLNDAEQKQDRRNANPLAGVANAATA